MITMKTDITVEPLTGALGAEVQGLDLNHLDDATWEQVHSLLLEHLVLFFPQQALTPDAHIALGRRFGEVEIHPFLRKVSEEYPEIVEIDSDKGPAEGWHTDATFSPTPPDGLHLADAHVSGCGWRHSVDEPAPGLRDALGAHEGAVGGVDRMALGRELRAPGAGERAPRGPGPPRDWAPFAVREPELHVARSADATPGERCAAPVLLRLVGVAALPVPLQVVSGSSRHLGQPVHTAPSDLRLRRVPEHQQGDGAR